MKKFNEIYLKICENSGRELEELRINNKKRIMLIMLISLGVSFLLAVITQNIGFIMLILVIIAVMLLSNKTHMNYKRLFKEKIIKEFIKNYSEKLEFYPSRGIPWREYLNADFERFDNYYTEDLITGEIINGINMDMAEVRTERESTDSDGNSTTYTLFHGLFTEVKLNKKVNQIMRVRKNTILDGNGNGIDTKLDMDSIEFEKIFDVHTTNKIECMQILTADIMQMLIDFKKNNKIVPEITLKGNLLYIRFKTGNVFEPKIMKSALDFDTLKKYYDIINFTLELVEKFSKNILETEI